MDSGFQPPKGFKTKICLTVDVEPSIANAFARPGLDKPIIHEHVWGEINGKSHALGFLIETLRDFGLKATFFVETMHTAHFGDRAMGVYVERLLAAGQDVQVHVHPCWLSFDGDQFDPNNIVPDQCEDHGLDSLIDVLGKGKDQLASWTGKVPVGFRTGSFSTTRDVFRAMNVVGLGVSSNIATPFSPNEDPSLILDSGVHEIESVIEFPATSFFDNGPVARGGKRTMQITACGAWEMETILQQAYQIQLPYIVIVTHPFEFLKRDGPRYNKMRPNKLNQERLKWLCQFVLKNSDRFEFVTLDEKSKLAPVGLNQIYPDLAVGPIPSLLRTAQNGINDRVWYL